MQITDMPIDQLVENPDNPRKQIGDVTDLAASIREQGIKQPLTVTPTGNMDIDGRETYRIVIGHRRYTAAKKAGLTAVPVIIEDMTRRQEREVMLVENCQRSDLTPLEEADAYQGILDLGASVEDAARKTGRSMQFVRDRVKIASIPASVRTHDEHFSQSSVSRLLAIAEFQGDQQAQNLLAETDDHDFSYELRRLRRKRDEDQWWDRQETQLNKAGITVKPINGAYWEFNVDGYERVLMMTPAWPTPEETRDIIDKLNSIDGGYDPEAVYGDREHHAFLAFQRIPQDRLDKEQAIKDEEKLKNARKTARTKARHEFMHAATDTRRAWLNQNMHAATRTKQTEAALLLARITLLGTTGYGFHMPHMDSVVKTLAAITRHEYKPGEWGQYDSLENLAYVRENVSTLDWLIALMETVAGTDSAWDSENGCEDTKAYYKALTVLGYQPSSEETAALNGAHALTKEDRK
ncbi:ParB/RepB/Spo0J family partition protein [uncultured Bifidobacterium sp.]|uniref:ParB/RepB/Spo0J family partition protein n=1 Tax=uncultured Bifidobacterium sp. TaxID=165187 RepID=UPI002583A98B|nr:ParB/RepB/Spo0J family partition protein [uncultured Bifidobacterium sp.]